ncbi:MAG: ferrochelatase [Longilinea sp.]|nr:ferrochelatase [Longilinea sp.]
MKQPQWLNRLRLGKQWGYETLFKNQDLRPQGKVGLLIGEMGMPEEYSFDFYNRYIRHVFEYTLPSFLQPVVLADHGIGLIDPENPLAREPFQPRQLIDAHGSFTNKAGIPYVQCPISWQPPRVPRNPWDHGMFLYRQEGKGGAPDICQKTGAKVCGWYYGHLIPEKKVAWKAQNQLLYDEARQILQDQYPGLETRLTYYTFEESLQQQIESLLAAGCQTILYQCISNPVYSDFEEYQSTLPLLYQLVNGRAKIICVPQLGNQPALRQAYVHMLRDQLATLPAEASVYVILSRHGHPFKKETQDTLAKLYREPLEAEIRALLQTRSARWGLTWSDDEYADEYWNPKRDKKETYSAYRFAIEENFDYAIELPTEFLAENTDLMIFHAMKKFNAFEDYDRNAPISYPDWEKPLVRRYHSANTTGIYTGCPVGPYRPHVVQAIVDSISSILN